METIRPSFAPVVGRELDAGKSTQKGSTNYTAAKGKSVMTDADTVVEVAGILAQTQEGKMKPEKLLQELQARGYQVELMELDGRKGIRFANGDILVDSGGDASIGAADLDVSNALTQVEQRFGINLGGLKAAYQVAAAREGKDKQAEAVGLLGGDQLAAQMQEMLSRLGFDPELLGDLDGLLGELDPQMAERGHQGASAYDLWSRGDLSATLSRLGMSVPALPSADEVAYPIFLSRSVGLFNRAYQLAGP